MATLIVSISPTIGKQDSSGLGYNGYTVVSAF